MNETLFGKAPGIGLKNDFKGKRLVLVETLGEFPLKMDLLVG